MRRRSVVYGVIMGFVLEISSCAFRDHQLEADFGKIVPGASADQAVSILGAPSWDGLCGAKLPGSVPGRCTREIGYAVTLAPINPSYYLIWFADDGRVVRTAAISSP